jgi:hypothetical protein
MHIKIKETLGLIFVCFRWDLKKVIFGDCFLPRRNIIRKIFSYLPNDTTVGEECRLMFCFCNHRVATHHYRKTDENWLKLCILSDKFMHGNTSLLHLDVSKKTRGFFLLGVNI